MGYKKNALKGITWMGSLRIFTRGVAYIKIAIIARILTPHQFGLFGIASLVLIFLETLTGTGINVFLVQEKKIAKYLDTAWTISILRGILISVAIALLAPAISNFFDSSESQRLLLLISIVPFLRGFINPSIIDFRKKLEFHKEFKFKLSLFIIESVVTIVFALLTKEASSIIYGLIVGALFEMVVSHVFILPRPKLGCKRKYARKIIQKGKWVTSSGILNYLAHQGDDIVVGYLLSPASLGIYQNAFKISSLPLTEVAQVVSSVTFPIYSKISGDLARLRNACGKVLVLTSFIIVPLGLIFYLFPKQIILVILGENWLEATGALQVLSIYGVIKAYLNTAKSIFHSLKRQDVVARLSFLEFFALAVIIIPFIRQHDIIGAGYASVISVIVAFPVAMLTLSKLLYTPDKMDK